MRKCVVLCLFISAIFCEALVEECPSFNHFLFHLKRQCPVMRDLRCVPYLPVDRKVGNILNCATAEESADSLLRVVDAPRLLEQIAYRDPYGRPWCMLTLFYSPHCVFSAKVAAAVYRLALRFPNLRVLAINVSSNSKGIESLISQYGIASTPVVALWENGYPRFRLYEEINNVDSLSNVIESRTDLKALFKSNSTENKTDDEYSYLVPRDTSHSEKEFLSQFDAFQENNGRDWYFVAAASTLLLNTVYFFTASALGRTFISETLPNFLVHLFYN
jgi:hypothetical protein